MSYPTVLGLLAFISIVFFPSSVLAKRGGGGGGGDALGDAISGLKLEPVIAAIFAFSIIFAILTALQAVQAAKNLYRRFSQQPLSISLPEFTTGSIFPIFLFFSTLTLAIFYLLNGIGWALTYNENANVTPSKAYSIANSVIDYLADVFLVSGILALLAHREKVLVTTPPMFRDIKIIFDAILCVTILTVGLGEIGLDFSIASLADFHVVVNLYTAHCALLFIAAIDIAATSVALYIRARGSEVNDHKIVFLVACIVSPSIFVWALYPLTILHVNPGEDIVLNRGLSLITVIIDCVTRFIVIAACLRFGMPPIPKKGKVGQET